MSLGLDGGQFHSQRFRSSVDEALALSHRGGLTAARLEAAGLGAYMIGAYMISATEAGDCPRIVPGIAVMSIFVGTLKRPIWRPLYRLAERCFRLIEKEFEP